MRIFLILCFILCASSAGALSLKELFTEGIHNLEKGNNDAAILNFEEILKYKIDFAPSYNFIGLAHKAKGESPNEFIPFFEKAIFYDHNFSMGYDNLGKAYYALGDYANAEKNCLKAVALDPKASTSQMSLGWIYLLRNPPQSRKAIKHFKEVITQSKNSYAYLGLGLAYFLDNQFPSVLEVITSLRKVGEESYAQHLEQMIREKRYIAPKIANISLNIPSANSSVIVEDSTRGYVPDFNDPIKETNVNEDAKGMQVYLKSGMPAEGSSEQLQNQIPPINPEDRIRALQTNGSRQNYQY